MELFGHVSLATEEQFYVVWPVVVAVLASKVRLPGLFVGLLVVATLMSLGWRLELALTGASAAYKPFYAYAVSALAALATAVIVFEMVGSGSGVARLLEARWLVWVGRISYGLYLWHFPIFFQFGVLRLPGMWTVRAMPRCSELPALLITSGLTAWSGLTVSSTTRTGTSRPCRVRFSTSYRRKSVGRRWVTRR